MRAEQRLDGADAVIRREAALQGEFDNGFDGVVSGIFHIVDAFELATTALRRDPREADQATRITSVVTALRQYGATDLPAASRLIGLNCLSKHVGTRGVPRRPGSRRARDCRACGSNAPRGGPRLPRLETGSRGRRS